MNKQVAAIFCLVLLVSFAGFGLAQVGTSSMPGQRALPGASALQVKVVDEKGQPVRVESLPKDVQAKLDRVRKAAEGLMAGPEGAAQRMKVTVDCSYPPFKCTITVSF